MNTIHMNIHNSGEREVINAVARLRWLMGLRWLALVGVSASASLAVIGLVPGINLVVMLLGGPS